MEGACWNSPGQEGPEHVGAAPPLYPQLIRTVRGKVAEASQTHELGQWKPNSTKERFLCKYIAFNSDTQHQVTEAAFLSLRSFPSMRQY